MLRDVGYDDVTVDRVQAIVTKRRLKTDADVTSLEAGAGFEAETRDATWASATEQAIHAVAPQLTDVTCRHAQCRVTLSAASEAELVAAVDQLQADDSLRSIEGVEQIMLTRPAEQGGTHAMQIYVRFSR